MPAATRSPRISGWRFILDVSTTAALFVLLAFAIAQAAGGGGPAVFINEIHYDNAGTDTGEFVEIAGPAGTDLSGYAIELYNGANGLRYDSDPLSGTIPNQQNGFGTVIIAYPTNGIQNGSPDGIALVNGATVIQFLSYEGSFTAVDGTAAGLTSTDVGVSENGSEPIGQSLQLQGTGMTYVDFTWGGPIARTSGVVNTGQTFGAGPTPAPTPTPTPTPTPPPGDVVISQVYGGGGNSMATLKNDFIELFNRSGSAVDVSGWSVQYASASGTSWQSTALSGSIPPGGFYLVQQAAGAGGTVNLPTPDATGSISMAASAGKVALANGTTLLSGSGCPFAASVVDFVGYGSTANCFEGPAPTAAPGNTTAVLRAFRGCTDSGSNSADFTTGAPAPRNSAAATRSCVPLAMAIHSIQGGGATSPHEGVLVSTSGVVTGRKSNGFFLQTPDSGVDADPGTSEGIFVFTTSAPPSTAAVGNACSVVGFVQEFVPSADPSSPPITEITGPPIVSLLSAGNPLPAPVTLTAADTDPAGSIEQLERFEGMRVHVESLTVISPTQGSINEASATSTTNGVFYGVVAGVERPFREPGVQLPDPLPPGAPPAVPRFDGNPERLRVDGDGQPGAPALEVTTGAIVTGLTGPLDYAFRTYTILPDPPPAAPPSVSGNSGAVAVPAPASEELSVASFNLQRFFDSVNAPGIGEPVLTPVAFENRLLKASLAIRDLMHSPDIVGVQEVENLETLQALAAGINADAQAAGQGDPGYRAYLEEGNDVGGIDVGFLVKGAPRVTVLEVTQLGRSDTFPNPDDGEPEILNDRPPLVLRATIQPPAGSPVPVTVIVNHLRSLNGIDDPADGNRVRTKRLLQAEFLAGLIQARQLADPSERIISVGDYNAFQFSDGYVDSIGTIKGTPTPADEVVLAGGDLVDPDLTDLVELAPASQRYSFSFDGNAQVLDHILATQNLTSSFRGLHFARNGADFPEGFRNDPAWPERVSDHDPVVAHFDVTPPRILSMSASPNVLWPPNHELVPVSVSVSAEDIGGASCAISEVSSSEPDASDWMVTGPLTLQLRAEREGQGGGRIYTITVSCADGAGNSSSSNSTVTVPHDQGKK